MEPVESGGVLGALMGAIADLNEPSQKYVDINANAPVEYRPLRFALSGVLTDIHPSQIKKLSTTETNYGTAAISISFGPEVTKWVSETTSIHIGKEMTLSVCGNDISAPIIREALTTGEMQITGGQSINDITQLLPIIAGQQDCNGSPMNGYVEKKPIQRRGLREN